MNKTLTKIGFIGCGKMAGAIISGIKSACECNHYELQGAEVNCEIAELAHNKLGIDVLTDNRFLTMNNDVVIIATKPNYVRGVLEEIKSEVTAEKLVVSIDFSV